MQLIMAGSCTRERKVTEGTRVYLGNLKENLEEARAFLFWIVKEFYNTEKIPNGLSSSTLILIPKESHALKVGHYRPIVLNNFLFKVFTKVLSTIWIHPKA